MPNSPKQPIGARRPRFTSTRQGLAAINATRRAVAAAGLDALAERLGIQPAAISQWTFCPPRHVLAVEAASGVSRCELRPDLYPAPRAPVISAEAAMAAHLAAGTRFALTGQVA